ncbi:hypothetical protein V8E36_000026 [Tilletia maclaganii]
MLPRGPLQVLAAAVAAAQLISTASSFSAKRHIDVGNSSTGLAVRAVPGPPAPTTLGQACPSNSDCGYDAPSCDFPFLFQPAPWNAVQKVCMLSPLNGVCRADDGCGTGYCQGLQSEPSFTCQLSQRSPYKTCKYDVDCDEGRCGTASDFSIDGASFEGRCVLKDGSPCYTSEACSTGLCQDGPNSENGGPGVCPPDDEYKPCTDATSCQSNMVCASRTTHDSVMVGTTDTFSFSQFSYEVKFCQMKQRGGSCMFDSQCGADGRCIGEPDGSWRCAFGLLLSFACTSDVSCDSRRCSQPRYAGSDYGFRCMPQPVGGPCLTAGQCSSETCTAGVCAKTGLGKRCYYQTDCESGACKSSKCIEPEVTSTTTTTTTSTSTSTATSTTSSTTTETPTTTSTTSSTTSSTSTDVPTSTSTSSTTTSSSSSTSTSTSTTSPKSTPTSSKSSTTTSSTTTTSSKSTSTLTSSSTSTTSPKSTTTTSTKSSSSPTSISTKSLPTTTSSSTTSKSSTSPSSSKMTSTTTSSPSTTSIKSTSKPTSTSTTSTSSKSTSTTSTKSSSTSTSTSTKSSPTTTSQSTTSKSTTSSSVSIKPSSTTSSSSTKKTTSSSSSSSTSTKSSSKPTSTSTTTTTTRKSSTTSKITTSTTKKASTTSSTSTKTSSSSKPTATLELGESCGANTFCKSGYCRAPLNPDGSRSDKATCDVRKASGASCYQNAGCVSETCTISKGASNGVCK